MYNFWFILAIKIFKKKCKTDDEQYIRKIHKICISKYEFLY